jgi:hypothetical protein
MRAILLHRGAGPHPLEQELAARGIPIVGSLTELAERVFVASGFSRTGPTSA